MSVNYEKYRVNGELPELIKHFQKCEKFIEPALEYDDCHEMQDIADAIADGSMQLWPTPKGAMVTQVQDYPRKRVLHVWWAGGELNAILELIPHIENFAKEIGCGKITCTGRKGWERVFKQWKNIKPTHFWLSMEV
jgi:hypothetical protein